MIRDPRLSVVAVVLALALPATAMAGPTEDPGRLAQPELHPRTPPPGGDGVVRDLPPPEPGDPFVTQAPLPSVGTPAVADGVWLGRASAGGCVCGPEAGPPGPGSCLCGPGASELQALAAPSRGREPEDPSIGTGASYAVASCAVGHGSARPAPPRPGERAPASPSDDPQTFAYARRHVMPADTLTAFRSTDSCPTTMLGMDAPPAQPLAPAAERDEVDSPG